MAVYSIARVFFFTGALLLLSHKPVFAASPSPYDILAKFDTKTPATYAITKIEGDLLVRRHNKTTFDTVTRTPATIHRDDILFIYPLTTIEITLDRKTRLMIASEGCVTLDELFKNTKITSVLAREEGAETLIIVRTAPPTIYEKRTVTPGAADILVREGKVWIAELDMYGNIVKKEMVLSAGESMTIDAASGPGGGPESASTPSPPPSGTRTGGTTAPSADAIWTTQYTSAEANGAFHVCVDGQNNIIVGGFLTTGGRKVAHIMKYDTNGNLLWDKTYDELGAVYSEVGGVAVDSQDNVIAVGVTLGWAMWKYDANGNFLWYLSAAVPDGGQFYQVAVDSSDNIIAAGSSDTFNGSVRKFTSAGAELWHKEYTDTNVNHWESVAVDFRDDSIVVNGKRNSVDRVSGDMHTTKYDAGGTKLWEVTDHIDVTQSERGGSVTIDPSGNIYAGGNYWDPVDSPRGILVKYDQNGTRLWRKYPIGLDILPGLAISGDIITTADGNSYEVIKFKESDDTILRTMAVSAGGEDFGIALDQNGDIITAGTNNNNTANSYAYLIKYRGLSGTSTLTKSVNRKEAVIGDILTYTITLHNPKAEVLTGVTFNDRLPPGFTYVRGSSVYDGQRISDPTGSRILRYSLGNISSDNTEVLSYQLIVGAGCIPGDYDNEANASGTYSGGTYTFNTAHAIVKVVLDPILQKGTIVGTVYWDHNENGVQEKGEEGIQGVKVYLEDGTSVATDKYGRYHFQGVNPGTHTVKIDKSSIKGKQE